MAEKTDAPQNAQQAPCDVLVAIDQSAVHGTPNSNRGTSASVSITNTSIPELDEIFGDQDIYSAPTITDRVAMSPTTYRIEHNLTKMVWYWRKRKGGRNRREKLKLGGSMKEITDEQRRVAEHNSRVWHERVARAKAKRAGK